MGSSGWCEGKRLDSCSGVGSYNMICVHDDAAHEGEGSESLTFLSLCT